MNLVEKCPRCLILQIKEQNAFGNLNLLLLAQHAFASRIFDLNWKYM